MSNKSIKNYAALTLAILSNMSVEGAFKKIENHPGILRELIKEPKNQQRLLN